MIDDGIGVVGGPTPEPDRATTTWPDVAFLAIIVLGVIALCAVCALGPAL